MKTVISDLQGVVMTNGAGLSGTFVENSLTVAGNVGFGAASPGDGKVIATITLTDGGTGYTNGNYAVQALTGGTGTGATADFIVAGGIVTLCGLRAPGVGYLAGDVLSCATIGAGAGLIVTVSTVGSSVASDGIVAAPRIGAGTTNPRAGLDVAAGGACIGGSTPVVANIWSGFNTRAQAHIAIAPFEPAENLTGGLTSLWGLYYGRGLNANPTGFSTHNGIMSYPRFETSAAGVGLTLTAIAAFSFRSYAADLATNASLFGVNAGCTIQTTAGSAATNEATVFQAAIANNMVGHTITTAHSFRTAFTSNEGTITTFSGIRLAPITGAGSIGTFYGVRIEATTTQTITNRFPIAQEDTLGTNFFRAKTAFGPATGTAPGDALASVEITTNGTTNGNLRLNTANAVLDVSAASTNGVKFNNPGTAGITGVTLANYQEGTFTVTDGSGAGLVITQNMVARYTRVGRNVTVICDITYPANANGLGAQILLPIPVSAVTYGGGAICWNDTAAARFGLVHDTVCRFYVQGVTAQSTNAALSGVQLIVTMTYTLA